jgi:hypothetical protein
MNVIMERAMNSENLGARITENGALDQKICAFEVLGVKWSFQEVLRGISIIFRVAGESWHKRQSIMQNLENFQGF